MASVREKKLHSSRSIVVCGNYGATNIGDESLLDGILQILRLSCPDAQITVLSSNPAATRSLHSVESVFQVPAGIRSFVRCFRDGSLKQTLQTIRDCDAFFLGGGGLFTDEKMKAVWIWFLQAMAAVRRRKPLFMIGQSVGPLTSWLGQNLAAQVFQRATFVTVRDTASADLLRSLHVPTPHVFADPAFMLETHLAAGAEREKFVVWTLRPWGNDARRYHECAKFIDWLFETYGLRSVLVPFQLSHDSDSPVLAQVASLVRDKSACEVYEFTDDVHEILELMGKATAVVGMRLHSMIFSIMTHTPLLALSYSSKVKNLMDDATLSDYVIPWAEVHFTELKKHFISLIDRREVISDRLGEAHILMRSNAQKHVDLVKEFFQVS